MELRSPEAIQSCLYTPYRLKRAVCNSDTVDGTFESHSIFIASNLDNHITLTVLDKIGLD